VIVLQVRSDVRRCANIVPVLCFNRLPHPCRWDAKSGEGVNVWLACCFDCRKWCGVEVDEAYAGLNHASKSEMDDNLSNETHRHAGWPGCIGPACVCDTPVIEMIAKPALPVMVRWYSLQATCNAFLLDRRLYRRWSDYSLQCRIRNNQAHNTTQRALLLFERSWITAPELRARSGNAVRYNEGCYVDARADA